MNLFKSLTIIIVSIFTWYSLGSAVVLAGPIDAIKNAILNTAGEIKTIDSEIKQIEVKLNETGKEKKSIQEVIDELKTQQNQLNGQINNAQSQIDQIESVIEQINQEIARLSQSLETKHEALGNNLQRILIVDDETLIEGLLKYESLAEYWRQTDTSAQLGAAINESMSTIREQRIQLTAEIDNQNIKKAQLVELQNQIAIDRKSIDIAKQEQDKLLSVVKNDEASYQSLLAKKRAERASFEADLSAYESQLNLVLNPATIPKPTNNKLSWPLSSVVITQYFGNTAFAQSGAYNGKGHNGIDLDLVVGTPVMSAMEGIVKGTGNTDNQCPYASYGMWVMIEHPNGISTMYAHLSQISVSPGQTVSRGQVIGYGGNTGYSTGSHLHFTVYRSDGVRISGLPSRSCPGATLTMPLADYSAYLNPLDYLE